MIDNQKFIAIIFFAAFIFKFDFFFFITNDSKNCIFTFWEPKGKIPGYLQLCIKTWKKYLPEYNIIILDYKKAKLYLGKSLFSNIVCKNMTLMLQADAIRVAILKKYGGIWMDADTIISNKEFIGELKTTELSMVGEEEINFQYISFYFKCQT